MIIIKKLEKHFNIISLRIRLEKGKTMQLTGEKLINRNDRNYFRRTII